METGAFWRGVMHMSFPGQATRITSATEHLPGRRYAPCPARSRTRGRERIGRTGTHSRADRVAHRLPRAVTSTIVERYLLYVSVTKR